MRDDYRWKHPVPVWMESRRKRPLKDVDGGKVKHLLLSSIFVITVSAAMFSPGML